MNARRVASTPTPDFCAQRMAPSASSMASRLAAGARLAIASAVTVGGGFGVGRLTLSSQPRNSGTMGSPGFEGGAMIVESAVGRLGTRPFREQALIPAHGLGADQLEAPEIRMRGIDQYIAFDVEDDARHAQYRGRGLLQPGIADLAARDHVRVVPAGDVGGLE